MNYRRICGEECEGGVIVGRDEEQGKATADRCEVNQSTALDDSCSVIEFFSDGETSVLAGQKQN